MSDRGAEFLGLAKDGDYRDYEPADALRVCQDARNAGLVIKPDF